MSRVLIGSITELCHADHDDDPVKVAAWTANKSPASLENMLAQTAARWFLAERDGSVAAVGAVSETGEILLNYVAVEARFQGVSSALLAHMEAALRRLGIVEARLKSTRTAERFYLARGWRAVDEIKAGRFIEAIPMRKTLLG